MEEEEEEVNLNFANCRVRVWGFVCIDCCSPPTARVSVDGMCDWDFGFLCMECCVSLTARVSVDGICDQCYMAAVLRLKFDFHSGKFEIKLQS